MRIKISVVAGLLMSNCLFGFANAAEQPVTQDSAPAENISGEIIAPETVPEKTTDQEIAPEKPIDQEVAAEEPIDPETINGVQKDIEFVASSKQTRDAINQFAEQQGIEFGVENKKGQIFYQATETVAVDETNQQWAKWRVVAYKKATMKIKQEFMESIYGKICGSTLQEYFNDESDDRLDFPDFTDPRAFSKYGEIWNKLMALTGIRLDRALEELGIDPAQYAAAPLEQRKNLFKNNLIERSVTRAAGQLGGIVPIKTFEGFDTKGNYTIGVIAMYYEKIKQLAFDITKKRAPMLTKKSGNPIQSYIPKNDKQLSEAFGVRLVFDETGAPAIISYGQWSYMYKGVDQKRLDRSYEFAENKAKTESQKQIAQFLNSSAFYRKVEEVKALDEEDAIMDRDGNIRQEDLTTMIDKLQSSMKVRFNSDLRGMKPSKRWSYKHPNGHEIVGVVTVWTQKNAENVDKIRNWKSSEHPQTGLHKQTDKSGVNEGVGMDTDF